MEDPSEIAHYDDRDHSFRRIGDGLIAGEVSDLRESWMKHADAVLADEGIVAAVYEALAKRHPKSRLPRASGRAGRRGAATVDPQAHPQLEL